METSNLIGLEKPATILIEKCAEVIGGVFKPWQMKRIAKAAAEIRYKYNCYSRSINKYLCTK